MEPCNYCSWSIGNYTQLSIARGFVGAGEAALTPAVWSMFPDIFNKNQLTLAMSIFSMAPYLGAGIALIAGAQVIEMSQSSPPLEIPVFGIYNLAINTHNLWSPRNNFCFNFREH